MSLKPYIKPFRDQEYMYRKLHKEGLVIDDKGALIDAITEFSYYRFKAYFIPFRLSNLNFKYATNFNCAFGRGSNRPANKIIYKIKWFKI